MRERRGLGCAASLFLSLIFLGVSPAARDAPLLLARAAELSSEGAMALDAELDALPPSAVLSLPKARPAPDSQEEVASAEAPLPFDETLVATEDDGRQSSQRKTSSKGDAEVAAGLGLQEEKAAPAPAEEERVSEGDSAEAKKAEPQPETERLSVQEEKEGASGEAVEGEAAGKQATPAEKTSPKEPSEPAPPQRPSSRKRCAKPPQPPPPPAKQTPAAAQEPPAEGPAKEEGLPAAETGAANLEASPPQEDATLEGAGSTEESGTFLSTEEGGLPRHRGAEELLLGGFLVMLAGSLKIQRIPAPWALYAVSCLIAIGLVTSIFGLLSNLSAQERRARWIKARGSILDQLGN